MMPANESIVDALVGINGYRVVDVCFDTERNTAQILIEPDEPYIGICSGCRQRVSSIKDRSLQTLRDVPAFSWKVELLFDRRRVICPRCGVRTELLPFADMRSRFTHRFEDQIFIDAVRHSASEAARRHDISWAQASLVEKKQLERYNEQRGPLAGIRWLGVDEICTGRRHTVQTIITDLETRSVIGIVDGHHTEALNAFYRLTGPVFCAGVEVVVMDMWKAFKASTKTFCPKALIVHDKFHIIRHLNDAVDEVRRSEFFRKGKEGREAIRGKRWLLLRRWFNLDGGQKGLLKELLRMNKKLSVAYQLKEMFGKLWDYTSRTWAIKFLKQWESQLRWQRLKPFKKFLKMIYNNLEGILNYCEVKVPLGAVEAINGKIKLIIRKARGFIDKRHAALKIMFLTDPSAELYLKRFHT